MSPSGIRLNNLTGIAAILRFELPELADMEHEDNGDIDSEEEGEQGASSHQGSSKQEAESHEESKSQS